MSGTSPLRRLTAADINTCTALSQAVGWQHTPAMWRDMIRWSGMGAYGIADWRHGEIVATALHFRYGTQRAWVGMVLTHPTSQGQGFARRLMDTILADLQKRKVQQIMLDASDKGHVLYTRMGFRDCYAVDTWWGEVPNQLPKPDYKGIRRATADDTDAIAALDAEIFGAHRPRIYQDLLANQRVWVDYQAQELQGFVVAKIPQKNLALIGAWHHRNPAGATALFQTACRNLKNYRVRVDVPATNPHAHQILSERNFVNVGGCTRMILGDVEFEEIPSQQYAILSYAMG